MKRHFHHPEPIKTGRRYWRSLAEHDQTPDFKAGVGREFDPGLSVMGDEERESSRRDFMKVMGGACPGPAAGCLILLPLALAHPCHSSLEVA